MSSYYMLGTLPHTIVLALSASHQPCEKPHPLFADGPGNSVLTCALPILPPHVFLKFFI